MKIDFRGISLANKCLLLFGGAVVLIVLAALTIPWIRMGTLVEAGELKLSRQLAATWERFVPEAEPQPGEPEIRGGIEAQRLTREEAKLRGEDDRFIRRALRVFEGDPARVDTQSSRRAGSAREYRYAKAVRAGEGGELSGMVVMTRQSVGAAWLVLVNATFLLTAGSFVLALAVFVFYMITHKIILGPVRALKETAELVRSGSLDVRSDIETGDEFEELAETFNLMLEGLQQSQDALHATNKAMDLKLSELAEANVALYETAKLKGEFLASVSHELRTPLNSIIGFGELLQEMARGDEQGADDPKTKKRLRYLDNIVDASKDLLEMINSLLEMAKLEAGKVELHWETVSIREACEALVALIFPLADRKGIVLRIDAEDALPPVETDVQKFQQIIFNFLSNAVKFTDAASERGGVPGQVTVRVEPLPSGSTDQERVRVSVIDTGPGIDPKDQHVIFEKFQQLDSGHTREHAGTGLGLAICKELAGLIQCEIQVVSEVGRGSMFSLIMPVRPDKVLAAEIKLERAFRGSLAVQQDDES